MLVLYLELWWPNPLPLTIDEDSREDPDLSPINAEFMPFDTVLLLPPPPLLLLLCCPINVMSPATTCSDAYRERCSNGQSDADVFSVNEIN